MKIGIFFAIYIILHIIVFVGILLIWILGLIEIIDPFLFKIFLIAAGILILIDVIFGIYYLIVKSPQKDKYSRRYFNYKFKIEEGDKYLEEKNKGNREK